MRTLPPARRCALPVAGKPVYRYTGLIEWSGLDRTLWCVERTVSIIARNPAEAANALLDEFGTLVHHPCTVTVAGPRGGTVVRYQGWEMAAARQLAVDWDKPEQFNLPLV